MALHAARPAIRNRTTPRSHPPRPSRGNPRNPTLHRRIAATQAQDLARTQPATHRREPAATPPTGTRPRRPTSHPTSRTNSPTSKQRQADNDRTVLTHGPANKTAVSRTASSTQPPRSEHRPKEIPEITIESVNPRIRRAVRARGHFPNEQAALKCGAICNRAEVPICSRHRPHGRAGGSGATRGCGRPRAGCGPGVCCVRWCL
jgi:hypothetical protein